MDFYEDFILFFIFHKHDFNGLFTTQTVLMEGVICVSVCMKAIIFLQLVECGVNSVRGGSLVFIFVHGAFAFLGLCEYLSFYFVLIQTSLTEHFFRSGLHHKVVSLE